MRSWAKERGAVRSASGPRGTGVGRGAAGAAETRAVPSAGSIGPAGSIGSVGS